MRRFLVPAIAALLLFAAPVLATTYTNNATGQQSPGYVPESTPGTPYSATNPIPIGGSTATRTDRSGTITAGGVAQVLMAANASRHGCVVQNQSTGDLWVSEVGTAAATQPSWWFPAGSYWNCESTGVPLTALSIFGATTGQAFAAREW